MSEISEHTRRRARQMEQEGKLQATRVLLAETQQQLKEAIADFCALRDALPRELVQQILRSERPPL